MTPEEKLADLGVRQFVRTKIVALLLESVGKPDKIDQVFERINHEIVEEFVVIAREEAKILMAKIVKKSNEIGGGLHG